jgi:hypothetical protein
MAKTARPAVRAEATRLTGLPRQQARLAFSGRVARAYLLEGNARLAGLDFNAHLATELRELAENAQQPNIWSPR